VIDSHGSHGGFLVVVASAALAVVATLASLRVLRRGTAPAPTEVDAPAADQAADPA
jgi:hypothetical protein